MQPCVLFVDDDQALLDGVRRGLRGEPYRILTAGGATEAMDLLERGRVDVIVSDDQMPGIRGSDFLAQVRLLYPGQVRLMLTGRATVEGAIQAINDGHIFRYLVKPCATEELAQAVRQAIGQKQLMDRCRQALLLIRRQSAFISHVRNAHPGVIDDALAQALLSSLTPEQADSIEELSLLMAAGIDSAEGLLPGAAGT